MFCTGMISIHTLIARRLLTGIPLLLAVACASFLLARAAPGNFLSDLGDNPQLSAETVELLRRQYEIDRPWYVQFFHWLLGVLRGDFGYSFACNCPVSSLLGERVLLTSVLAISALLLALAIAFPLGIVAAGRRGRLRGLLDAALSLLSTVGLALPSFLLALGALVLAAWTGWFPIGGVQSLGAESFSASQRAADFLHHLILPAMVLAVRLLPAYLRQLRTGLEESMRQDYITLARAKGLPESRVLVGHALRNALNPVVTLLGNSVGSLLSGAFIVEAIMSWPGLGSLAVNALLSRDLNVMVACLLLAAGLLLLGNLLADLLLLAVDPRITYGRRAPASLAQ
jgi:peptide/nickel transport system permease protein